MNWKFAPLFIVCLAYLSACGGGGNSGGSGPQQISVTFMVAPAASMNTGAQAGMSANVANDSANAGVTWSCAPAGACGSFNPTSTASGTTTTYTAPNQVPTGGKVTITATSVTDTTKNAQTTTTINGPAITVTLSQAPPSVLQSSATASVTATTNDPVGVNWSCAPAGSCGQFSPTPTASGTATTYTAPAQPPTGGKVTLTATSVTNSSVSASASVAITGTASLATLKGQYAFLVLSPTGARGTAAWLGSINLDGNGHLVAVPGLTASPTSLCPNAPIAGMEDVVSPGRDDQADPILPSGATSPASVSAYTADASGHGTLTMSTCNGETLVISFVATSASHAEIIEADGNPGSGSLDLQNPTPTGFSSSQISGAYSFTLDGIDATGIPPAVPQQSMGGVFTVSSSSSITGTIDVNSAGSFSTAAFSTGSIAAPPDLDGRGQLVFSPSNQSTPASQTRTFIFYIVSPKVLRIFENDGVSYMGGSAYAQGTTSANLSGNYVYQHSGWKPANAMPPTGRIVTAGQFSVTIPGASFSGGISDSNSGATATTPLSAAVSGSYQSSTTEGGTLNLTLTDAAGSSTFNAYQVDPSLNILDPSASGGGGALLLHTDANITGTGVLLPQNSPAPFLGNYALNLSNSIAATTQDELDLVGVLSADGVSSFISGATNLADYDQNNGVPSPVSGAPLSGTFSADTTHSGRFTGSFTVALPPAQSSAYPFIPGKTPSTFNVTLYQASSSQAFVVQTDNTAITTGRVVQQILP